MLPIHISSNTGVPVYRQIMDQLKYCLTSGILSTGDQLPSIRALAKQLAVNPSTVVKAYNELEHEGVIENRQGRGAFVADTGSRLTPNARRDVVRNLAKQLWVEAHQLGLQPDIVERILDEERQSLDAK